jgi:hypothetical protein
MVVRTRAATETDADSIETLYQEFTRYLRALGDETEAKLTADIYQLQGQALQLTLPFEKFVRCKA